MMHRHKKIMGNVNRFFQYNPVQCQYNPNLNGFELCMSSTNTTVRKMVSHDTSLHKQLTTTHGIIIFITYILRGLLGVGVKAWILNQLQDFNPISCCTPAIGFSMMLVKSQWETLRCYCLYKLSLWTSLSFALVYIRIILCM
jgi:hypothetical protein